MELSIMWSAESLAYAEFGMLHRQYRQMMLSDIISHYMETMQNFNLLCCKILSQRMYVMTRMDFL